MDKKKLIIFMPSIEYGGVEKNLYIISDYLAKKNINIEILTCNYDKKKKFNKKIKIIGTKNNFWINKSRKIKYIICLIFLFLYLIKDKSKKTVFAFQGNIYAILVAKLTFSKVIVRSNSSPTGWSNNYFKKIFYKFVIKFADDVVVNSTHFKNEFKKKFNIDAKCILNPFDKKYYKEIEKIKVLI